MSNQTESAPAAADTSSSAKSNLGAAMTGAEILVAAMEREGVDTIFAYPGGASMPIHQALSKSTAIRTILPRHEQGGSFAAEGYARATGRAGVCMGTSGPGATNMVTAIADAFLDSTPMVAISGQVPTFMIGRGAFQETDFYGMTLPCVKHSYLVTDINDIPRVVKEAFHIAQTGRPGPVVIDMPKDVQEGRAQPIFPDSINLRGYTPERELDEVALNELLGFVKDAERPMIYCGGGIISSEAHDELMEFVERSGIPVATTLMGVGCFPETHEMSLKWLGMHGTVYANNAVNEADVLLALGVRFDDRVTGKVEKFAEHGTIIHIDIDNSEINKNKSVRLPIIANVKEALARLNQLLADAGHERKKTNFDAFPAWYEQIATWKKDSPMKYVDTDEQIQPQYAIQELYKACQKDPRETYITTGVGQHQMWAGQWYEYDKPRRFITSAGLGSMGYGYPAAMGVCAAFPDANVIDIDGDGSFLMNIQELACAKVEKLAAKALVLNNQHLGMVVQWEDLKYDSNRAQTFLADPDDGYDPTHKDESKIFPDYPKMCAGFRVECRRVIHKEDLAEAMEWFVAAKEAVVLEVMVPYTEHVLPMIPGGMTYKDIITEPFMETRNEINIPTAL
ncbi:biosynthetic-type acetolactate synthase large subunit [Verrucomicrobiales bacterium]|nr:biosynthetic-type acetolactate synthase large subunit [Verrucomicrobiales bacterium]